MEEPPVGITQPVTTTHENLINKCARTSGVARLRVREEAGKIETKKNREKANEERERERERERHCRDHTVQKTNNEYPTYFKSRNTCVVRTRAENNNRWRDFYLKKDWENNTRRRTKTSKTGEKTKPQQKKVQEKFLWPRRRQQTFKNEKTEITTFLNRIEIPKQ